MHTGKSWLTYCVSFPKYGCVNSLKIKTSFVNDKKCNKTENSIDSKELIRA